MVNSIFLALAVQLPPADTFPGIAIDPWGAVQSTNQTLESRDAESKLIKELQYPDSYIFKRYEKNLTITDGYKIVWLSHRGNRTNSALKYFDERITHMATLGGKAVKYDLARSKVSDRLLLLASLTFSRYESMSGNRERERNSLSIVTSQQELYSQAENGQLGTTPEALSIQIVALRFKPNITAARKLAESSMKKHPKNWELKAVAAQMYLVGDNFNGIETKIDSKRAQKLAAEIAIGKDENPRKSYFLALVTQFENKDQSLSHWKNFLSSKYAQYEMNTIAKSRM